MCFRRMTEHVIKCMNRQPQRIFDSVKNGSPAHPKWSGGDGYTKYRLALALAMTERAWTISGWCGLFGSGGAL
jgi:hypothetical protein